MIDFKRALAVKAQWWLDNKEQIEQIISDYDTSVIPSVFTDEGGNIGVAKRTYKKVKVIFDCHPTEDELRKELDDGLDMFKNT